ncbi:MAG: DUF58 domain-containing protein [Chitinophagales bacterium]|nr:DUF58 domain-containing protein [Bacteroidota bacterium]MBK8683024.1 DUF58 domain-containing protein [Bacteroidota bacterium]
MDKATLLKKVRLVEIKTKGLSQHIFSGEYHSAFKGRGMSFSEVRSYTYGDDVRNIDWNVTARMQQPYIKVFEEERELTVMLLIDISPSSYFGTIKQSKNELITEMAAVLAFSAINNNDKVGVLLFTDKIEKFIPPKKGRSHILRIISELLDYKPEGKGTDIAKALEFFSGIIKKRCTAFLFSDFMSDDYEKPLRIAARRHDLIGVQIWDRREKELPAVGMMRMRDAETGEKFWVDTNSNRVRKNYREFFDKNTKYFETTFLKSGADTMHINSEKSYITELHNFFSRRMFRR